MRIAMIGLGRMGANMAQRLLKGGHELEVFDPDLAPRKALVEKGAKAADSLAMLVSAMPMPRVVWLMIPAGKITDTTLKIVLAQLEPLVRADPPIDDPELAAFRGATFVEPELVCEVGYLEITKSTKKMRAPTFKGMRPDKTPDECVLELRRGSRG